MRFDLSNKTDAEFVRTVDFESSIVTFLDLSWSGLGDRAVSVLTQSFAAISPCVTSINLRSNGLHNKPVAELVQIVAAIPSSVTSIDLGSNGLGNKPVAELVQILSAIPSSVTSIGLSSNVFDNKTGYELAQFFSAIPSGVTTIGLANNLLGKKTGAELAQAFSVLPMSVTSIFLGSNNFGGNTVAELVQLFSALPPEVTSIDLSGNNLDRKTLAEWVQIFAALPVGVTSLGLGGNFSRETGDATKLSEIIAYIPASVRSIALIENYFGADELAKTFAAVPAGVTSVNLCNNQLGHKTVVQLAQAFAVIPSSVTSIDLRWNSFHLKADTELYQILSALHPLMKSINLDGNSLFDFETVKKSNWQWFNQKILQRAFFTEDQRLMAVTSARPNTFFSLKGSGSSELSRVIVPLLQMHHQRFNQMYPVGQTILDFLVGDDRSFRMLNLKGIPGSRVFQHMTKPSDIDASRVEEIEDQLPLSQRASHPSVDENASRMNQYLIFSGIAAVAIGLALLSSVATATVTAGLILIALGAIVAFYNGFMSLKDDEHHTIMLACS